MAAVKVAPRKSTLTKKRATNAAKKAQKRYQEVRTKKKASAWQKGGKQWSRVLGHFGVSE